jgi:branched-chain amino acid transport system permease protein
MFETILLYGLFASAILLMISLGFSINFGLSGIANLSYGGIYLTAAYLAWYLFNVLKLPWLVTVLITVVAMAILGALIYKVLIIRVRGNVMNEVVLTIAIGLFMIELYRWLGFGGGMGYTIPSIISGRIGILGQSIDYQRIIIVVIAILVALILLYFTRYTKTGLALLGMAQDEYTALSLGIDSDWSATYSCAIGAAITALAALLILPLGLISIDEGYKVLIRMLAVTVFGGLESTKGLILSCFILGYIQVIVSNLVSTGWTEVVFVGAILFVLAFKPSGLLGQSKELEERV